MKRYILLFAIIILVPFLSSAQGLTDALRYSDIQVQGTARSGAMGNAFGALGGDFTSVSINPAGLGLYRSGEFAVTASSTNTNNESSYWGTNTKATDSKFSLNNISYVSTIPIKNRNEAGIISVSLGIGYNRLKKFNSNTIYQGSNVNGSYMDYVVDNANYYGYDHNNNNNNNSYNMQFYEDLAWETYMMNHDDNLNEYYSEIGDAGYNQFQRKSIDRNGSIDEYSIATGINFNHKFYLGVSVGFIDVYYRESSRIYEEDSNNDIPNFDYFAHNSFLRTNGYGYNLKFGAIYKPVNEVRLGISIHTPTYYKLNDLFETSMESYIDWDINPEGYQEYSPTNNYNYKLRTPLKATFSGAFIIAKKGLISVDYEYVDYSNAEFRSDGTGDDFSFENEEIQEAYKSSGNLRIGGEYRLSNTLSLRGGYELHGSAFNEQAFGSMQPNSNADLNIYSGGLGYKSGLFSFDLAYRYSVLDAYDLPYQVPVDEYYPAPQMASVQNIKHKVLFTFGYKF